MTICKHGWEEGPHWRQKCLDCEEERTNQHWSQPMSDLVKRLRQAGDDIAEAVRERYGFDEFDSLEHQAADRIEELEEQLQITKLIKDSKIQEVTELEAEEKRFKHEYEVNMHNLLDTIETLEEENKRLTKIAAHSVAEARVASGDFDKADFEMMLIARGLIDD